MQPHITEVRVRVMYGKFKPKRAEKQGDHNYSSDNNSRNRNDDMSNNKIAAITMLGIIIMTELEFQS